MTNVRFLIENITKKTKSNEQIPKNDGPLKMCVYIYICIPSNMTIFVVISVELQRGGYLKNYTLDLPPTQDSSGNKKL